MGKSYKHMISSFGYGQLKNTKLSSHRKIRSHNKHCDELNIMSIKNLHRNEIGKNHLYHDYTGNLSNKPNFHFNDDTFWRMHRVTWNKNITSQLDTVNAAINECKEPEYFMCKKQIERRGAVGLFYGHR